MGHGAYAIDVMKLLLMFDFVICEMTSESRYYIASDQWFILFGSFRSANDNRHETVESIVILTL